MNETSAVPEGELVGRLLLPARSVTSTRSSNVHVGRLAKAIAMFQEAIVPEAVW